MELLERGEGEYSGRDCRLASATAAALFRVKVWMDLKGEVVEEEVDGVVVGGGVDGHVAGGETGGGVEAEDSRDGRGGGDGVGLG